MVGSSPPPYRRAPGAYRENYQVSTFSFGRCCCCVLSLVVLVAVILGVIALVVFMVIKPKKPEFNLQSVTVVSLQTEPPLGSALTSMEVLLTLRITMAFSALNPNKVGIKYSSSNFYVMYKDMRLGVAMVPPFYQPSHSNTTVETELMVTRVNILQVAAQDLIRDATVNDRVPLRIVGDVGARIRVLQINSPKVQVSLNCEIVISPRRRTLTDKQCGVDSVDGVNF